MRLILQFSYIIFLALSRLTRQALLSSWDRSTRWRVLRRSHSSYSLVSEQCSTSSTPPGQTCLTSCYDFLRPPDLTCSDQALARFDSPPAVGRDRPPGCRPSQQTCRWRRWKISWMQSKYVSTCCVCWSGASRWSCSPWRLSSRSLSGSLQSFENLGIKPMRCGFVEFFNVGKMGVPGMCR